MKASKLGLFIAASIFGIATASAAQLSPNQPTKVSATLEITPSYCQIDADTSLGDVKMTTNQLKKGQTQDFNLSLSDCALNEPVNITVKPTPGQDLLKLTLGTDEASATADQVTLTDVSKDGTANPKFVATIAAASQDSTEAELTALKNVSFDLTQDYTAATPSE